MDPKEIDVPAAIALLDAQQAVFVDIRDAESYRTGHVPGATHVTDGNIAAFTAAADTSKTIVVYCYHGRASRGGAQHFAEQGFDAVSLIGGYTAWSAGGHPSESAADATASPNVSVTDEAVAQLQSYMKAESGETRVRLTLDGSRFGLALDEARPGEVRFEQGGLPFVVEAKLAKPVEGVRIGWSPEAGGFTIDGGTPPAAPGAMTREAMREEIEGLVRDNAIVLFLKGTADSPMCGFSARASQIIQSLGKPFADKNALSAPEYRYVLSEFSDWPTLPQVFVGGKLVGGSDILMQMHESGDLAKVVESAFSGE
jgi:monothiol glutaredoxin